MVFTVTLEGSLWAETGSPAPLHPHPSTTRGEGTGTTRRSQQEEARAQGDSGPQVQGLKEVVQDPHPPLLLLLPQQPGDPSPLPMKAWPKGPAGRGLHGKPRLLRQDGERGQVEGVCGWEPGRLSQRLPAQGMQNAWAGPGDLCVTSSPGDSSKH